MLISAQKRQEKKEARVISHGQREADWKSPATHMIRRNPVKRTRDFGWPCLQYASLENLLQGPKRQSPKSDIFNDITRYSEFKWIVAFNGMR